jgi:hypothetical protein
MYLQYSDFMESPQLTPEIRCLPELLKEHTNGSEWH